MKIAIQNSELGQRGGINTYTNRLCRYLNQLDDVEATVFARKFRGKCDLISIQYEPGMLPPSTGPRDNRLSLQDILRMYDDPVVITAHHINGLQQMYPMIDGVLLHDKSQIVGEEPYSYCVVPHPALVYPKKDKMKLREKYNLPKDKKIIGTMGFICGTGKILPLTVQHILKKLKKDEFLYLITPFWKGGDMGRLNEIKSVVKESGKEDNFKIETDFMVNEEILNEKMQCCDLLYAWNNMSKDMPGSQSGSAADMYGSRVKLIVKDCPHYSFIGKQDKVFVGREKPNEFVDDIFDVFRNEDLTDTQDPEWLSWESKIEDMLDYFKEVAGL